MKWGRKKPPSSSSHPSLISHVFPISWLTKFKQMSISSGEKQGKVKWKGRRNSVSTPSTSKCGGGDGALGGKFYGGDGDEFWRISFGEDGVVDGEKNRSVQESVRDYTKEEPEILPSTCQSCRPTTAPVIGKGDTPMFSSLDSGAEIRTPRLKLGKGKRLKKTNQRVFKVKQLELNEELYEGEEIPRKAVTEKFSELLRGRTMEMIEREDIKLTASDSRKDRNFSSEKLRDPYLRIIEEEDCPYDSDGYSAEILVSDWKRLNEMKIEKLKARSEKQRKSLYISRELQRKRPKENIKVRACSPRTASKVETCKIKALQDVKRARLKKKKKAKEKTMETFSGLESVAMVKFSFDPQKDFRDSMIEMIQENRISQSAELEELLACYLTLNSDEYHDLIIKVFRQVWLDLNDVCLKEELDEHDECFYD